MFIFLSLLWVRFLVSMGRVAVGLEPYQELTGKIIGCAMQVHRVLGIGFQEVIYQRALAVELAQCGINA